MNSRKEINIWVFGCAMENSLKNNLQCLVIFWKCYFPTNFSHFLSYFLSFQKNFISENPPPPPTENLPAPTENPPLSTQNLPPHNTKTTKTPPPTLPQQQQKKSEIKERKIERLREREIDRERKIGLQRRRRDWFWVGWEQDRSWVVMTRTKCKAIGEEGLGCLWIGDEGGWAKMRDRWWVFVLELGWVVMRDRWWVFVPELGWAVWRIGDEGSVIGDRCRSLAGRWWMCSLPLSLFIFESCNWFEVKIKAKIVLHQNRVILRSTRKLISIWPNFLSLPNTQRGVK